MFETSFNLDAIDHTEDLMYHMTLGSQVVGHFLC